MTTVIIDENEIIEHSVARLHGVTPLSKVQVDEAINGLYDTAQLTGPRKIIHTPSPFAAVDLDASLGEDLDPVANGLMGGHLFRDLGELYRADVAGTLDHLTDVLQRTLWRHSTGVSFLRVSPHASARRSSDLESATCFLGYQAGELAQYDVLEALERNLSRFTPWFDAHVALSRSGWLLAYDTIAIAADAPQESHRDPTGALHHATGPALRYSDGHELYCFHGHVVTERAVRDPLSLALSDVRAHRGPVSALAQLYLGRGEPERLALAAVLQPTWSGDVADLDRVIDELTGSPSRSAARRTARSVVR